jgi:hypothetical protein
VQRFSFRVVGMDEFVMNCDVFHQFRVINNHTLLKLHDEINNLVNIHHILTQSGLKGESRGFLSIFSI